jgi:competence protein ComFC
LKATLLDWIYPPKCILCENIILLTKERWMCNNCQNSLDYVKNITCIKCGIPYDTENKICLDCKKREFSYTKNHAILKYDEVSKHLIFKFKYSNHAEVGKALISIIINNIDVDIFKGVDFLTPVPVHKKRLKTRGFNQAEILSRELSKHVGIPTINKLIIRVKNTTPQSKLTPTQRDENLKDAFMFNDKYNIEGKVIMVVDDIYTTGRTLDECSKILLKNKSGNIYGLTLSIVVKEKDKRMM